MNEVLVAPRDSRELRALLPTLMRVLRADGVFVLAVRGYDCMAGGDGTEEFMQALPKLLQAGSTAQHLNGGPDDDN